FAAVAPHDSSKTGSQAQEQAGSFGLLGKTCQRRKGAYGQSKPPVGCFQKPHGEVKSQARPKGAVPVVQSAKLVGQSSESKKVDDEEGAPARANAARQQVGEDRKDAPVHYQCSVRNQDRAAKDLEQQCHPIKRAGRKKGKEVSVDDLSIQDALRALQHNSLISVQNCITVKNSIVEARSDKEDQGNHPLTP